MITIELNSHSADYVEAINIMRHLGFSEEEIQKKVDEQNQKDKS